MALADAVAGALRPIQEITWLRANGEPENLGAATLTGYIYDNRSGSTRAIAGTLAVTDAANGVFTWTYDETDVVAGRYRVQFVASFGSPPSPAKTFVADWQVLPSLTLSEE